MTQIRVLKQDTIDQIAAGEVVERPASIVKELVENAVDAGAGAVTVEIREGGIEQIRVTDNGEGIDASQIRTAFLRHATSKLEDLSDLDTIATHGFRGEALSSIAAVSMTEMITKRPGALTGSRYRIEGGKEVALEEIGAPEGTTVLVRNLFYNVPARKKFLKSAVTEAGYVNELMERLALSHPGVSFKFISGGKTKLYTSGNHQQKDVIYAVYGRETAASLLPVSWEEEGLKISGFVGKPSLSRGNRSLENYFVNDRFVRSNVISKAIEEAYKTFMMQHRFPFTCLSISVDGRAVDVNVHPAKLEVRFGDTEKIYNTIKDAVSAALIGKELIPPVSVSTAREDNAAAKEDEKIRQEELRKLNSPEPFETLRRTLMAESKSPYRPLYPDRPHRQSEGAPALYKGGGDRPQGNPQRTQTPPAGGSGTLNTASPQEMKKTEGPLAPEDKPEKHSVSREEQQLSFNTPEFLADHKKGKRQIIGQLFDTYWLVQFEDSLYIIDQHAAHEKVMYERLVRHFKERSITSQSIMPPVILSLSAAEESALSRYGELFSQAGFEIEPFGGHEYQLRSAPDQLLGIPDRDLLIEMLGELSDTAGEPSGDVLFEKLATMACKSAVKGGNRLSVREAEALIEELMTLDNPYNCPHGRPTIIKITRSELEKKFKRIV